MPRIEDSAVHDVPEPLVGRERELGRLGELIDNVGVRGGAVVVRGEPGTGKSALLAAAARARARKLVVRSAVGVQSEAQFAFAGLHQLVQPFLARRAGLPAPQRRALEVAFGMAEGDAPDVFMIGLATLGLPACLADPGCTADQIGR